MIDQKENDMAHLQDKQKNALKRVPIILLSALLAYILLSMAFSSIVFHVLFARSEIEEKAGLLYADVDAKVYEREEIFFPSGENRLHGYLYAARGDAQALLIFAGGTGSSADSYLAQVVRFVDHGFAVLTYDCTGVNGSEGNWRRGLPQAKLDLLAAIDYAQSDEELSELPLCLYGHSLGGYAVGAALCERQGITAAVCVCAFDRPTKIMCGKAKEYVGLLAAFGYPFMRLENFFLFGGDADSSAKDSIDAVTTPTFIIKAGGDTVVPEEYSVGGEKNDFSNPNVALLTVSEEGRNAHSTLWLTAESAEYLLKALEEGETIDRARANVLDEDFMNCIFSFYTEAIKKAS